MLFARVLGSSIFPASRVAFEYSDIRVRLDLITSLFIIDHYGALHPSCLPLASSFSCLPLASSFSCFLFFDFLLRLPFSRFSLFPSSSFHSLSLLYLIVPSFPVSGCTSTTKEDLWVIRFGCCREWGEERGKRRRKERRGRGREEMEKEKKTVTTNNGGLWRCWLVIADGWWWCVKEERMWGFILF